MAGIGFELRRLLQQETFTAQVRAYAFGAIIVLGPFLCAILCLAGLGLGSASVSDLATRQTFTGAVTYVFGGSLVTTGLVQVVTTRYLADKVYRGEYDTLIQALFPVLLLTVGLLLLVAIPALARLDLSPLAIVTTLALAITLGLIWVTIVFVSSVHGHRAIVAIFLVGSAVALGLGLTLLRPFGLEGMLFGYAAGHFLILALLVNHLVRQFGLPRRWDWGVLGYVQTFPSLLAIGFLQALGIWIDKFVFWTSELALSSGGFVTAPRYDSAIFLAVLSAQPAVVHFFVKQEADFEQAFHAYFDEVFFRSSFDKIRDAATELRNACYRALTEILWIQGVITFLCLVHAEAILRTVGLPVSQIGMFRSGVVGSLFLIFMMFANVILLYLDRRREVLISVTAFALVNLGASLVSLRLGFPYFGFGYAVACLIGMVTSLYHLMAQLEHLEFQTFAMIPIMGQRRAGRGLRARPTGLYGRYNPVTRRP